MNTVLPEYLSFDNVDSFKLDVCSVEKSEYIETEFVLVDKYEYEVPKTVGIDLI